MADKWSYKDFNYDNYKESGEVRQAKSALNTQLAQKPSAYQSQWQTQLNDVMDKINNREKFTYDLNGDALYQQYKDKFIQQGKLASADVMGQASAMTGGYGNSYAASVGNQAYQASLQNLNDVIPELYQMAYDRYSQEGQDLYNQYGLLADRENTDYGRYRDSVTDFNAERDYLAGRYDSERSYDYSKYTDARNFAYGQYADDKSYAYNDYRNNIADAQWNETMKFNKEQANKTVPSYLGVDKYATIYEDAELMAGDRYALESYLAEMEAQGLPSAIADSIFLKYFPEEEEKEDKKKNKGGTVDSIN